MQMMLLVLLSLVLVGGVVYFMVKEKSESSTPAVDQTWVHEFTAENERQLLATNQQFKTGDFPVDSGGNRLDVNTCKDIGFVPKAVVDKWILAKAAISSADRQLTDPTSKTTIAALDKWNQNRAEPVTTTKAGVSPFTPASLANDADVGLQMLLMGPLMEQLFITTHSYSANAADYNLYSACIQAGLTMHPQAIMDKLRSHSYSTIR